MFDQLRSSLEDPGTQRAQVLLGPRQVGKTRLLWQLAADFLDRGWPPTNVLYFDFRDDRLDRPPSLRSVLEAIPPGLRSDHPRLILLDEVTQAPSWDASLKLIVDEARSIQGELRPRVLVTDSAASIMRQGARDSLQGRVDQIRLRGLTFAEALSIQATGGETARDVFMRLPGATDRYLARGGLPEHVTTDSSESVWERIRRDVVEGAIARDLSRRTDVDTDRVTSLFRHLVQSSGAIFEASNRAQDLREGDRGPDARTIRKWVDLLEQACLLESLRPWHRGIRRGQESASRALTARRKIYAEDHGFVPAFSPSRSPMGDNHVRGRVFETVVHSHLRALRDEAADFDLYYFREKDRAEIDFVLAFDETVIGVEVTSSKEPDKKVAQLRRASERASVDRLILVHGGLTRSEFDHGISVPLDTFLLDLPSHINEVAG